MKIYLTGAFEQIDPFNGYGSASKNIYENMKKLGVDVNLKKLTSVEEYDADIEISFCEPRHYNFMCPTSYKIGYTPWESTKIYHKWNMSVCDEVWGTSTWVSNVFKKEKVHEKIFTYPHGLDKRFFPKKRFYNKNKPFTFLFIGEPFSRKGGQVVAEAFLEIFKNNLDYRLIIKGNSWSSIEVLDEDKILKGSPEIFYENVIGVYENYSFEEMISLYEMADVIVYPSYGEGFGFLPLQAIGMGIPVISTWEWAEYAEYITAPLDSEVKDSIWKIHPGQMYFPNKEHLKELMLNAKNNHEEWCEKTFNNSFLVHEKFNWENVTKNAIERLKNIQNSRNL